MRLACSTTLYRTHSQKLCCCRNGGMQGRRRQRQADKGGGMEQHGTSNNNGLEQAKKGRLLPGTHSTYSKCFLFFARSAYTEQAGPRGILAHATNCPCKGRFGEHILGLVFLLWRVIPARSAAKARAEAPSTSTSSGCPHPICTKTTLAQLRTSSSMYLLRSNITQYARL